MSGSLMRLVGRALGLGSTTVHSAARLPYAPPPALAEPAGPAAPPDSIPGAGAPVAERMPARDPVTRFYPHEDNLDGLVFEAPAPESTKNAPAGRKRDAEPHPEAGEGSERRDDPAEPEAAATGGRTRTAHAPERLMEPVPELHGRGSPKADENGSGVYEGTAADRIPAEFAEPLLPLEAAPRLPSWRAGALFPDASRGPASAKRSEETTEVHVSIGRIEVTAVHEAPPSKRSPTPASKPMSLAEYLARRRGGRP